MAALRDASWYKRPDTRAPKRYHIVAEGGGPACGSIMILGDREQADRVPDLLRCKRPGCRSSWASVAAPFSNAKVHNG